MNRRTVIAIVFAVAAIAIACGALAVHSGLLAADNTTVLHVGTRTVRPPMLAPVEGTRARNVILIVGDGMGFTQLSAGRIALRGPDGILWIQTLPSSAIVRTQSASSLVTDSAAAATAMATGVRVPNTVVSVDANGKPLRTLFEKARARGLAAGIVTTTDLTDATPAAFVAHVKSRRDRIEIADQQSASGIEVMLGGGPEHFLPVARGGRRVRTDLVESMRAAGYTIALEPAALATPKSGKLLGLFEDTKRPPLSTMTRVALETLARDPEGFVLLVENEETDSASHRHELPRLIRGMQELDEAVRIALEFAKADGRTLVVVTADHETGGMQLVETKVAGTLGVRWINGKHTAQPVPLFAWGPGASSFAGEIDNTAIHRLLVEALGLEAEPPEGRP
ncbi:MAG: alkaline phosphatase [Thermoanaerobaculia bacterium]|nr:alkaline phosphatase [Thermoanaerobaculia bacterium]